VGVVKWGARRRARIIAALRPSLAYAALVFGVGFVLGSVRVFLVVPRIGVRWAELLEAPLMLFASFLAARFVTKFWGVSGRAQCMAVGILALGFMLFAEASFVLVQGFSIAGYVASRDPVSGSVYLLSLAVFAAMPLLVSLARGSGISRKRDGPVEPAA
jgi:hypothetical protein